MEFETLRNVETPAGRRRRLNARQYFLHDFSVGGAGRLFDDDLVDLALGVDMKARRHIAGAGFVLRRRVTRDLRIKQAKKFALRKSGPAFRRRGPESRPLRRRLLTSSARAPKAARAAAKIKIVPRFTLFPCRWLVTAARPLVSSLNAPLRSPRGRRRGYCSSVRRTEKAYHSIVQWKWTLCAAKKPPPGGAGA